MIRKQRGLTHLWLLSNSLSDIIKEYRKLDDAITMRLNRSVAQWQDRDRHAERSSSRQDPCEYLWKELVGEYCS